MLPMASPPRSMASLSRQNQRIWTPCLLQSFKEIIKFQKILFNNFWRRSKTLP